MSKRPPQTRIRLQALKALATAATPMAAAIIKADRYAEQLLIAGGAASDATEAFDEILDELLLTDAPCATRAEVEEASRAFSRVLESLPSWEERNDVSSGQSIVRIQIRELAYALGVAVGLRLAGGMR